jgi:hypothetical protein
MTTTEQATQTTTPTIPASHYIGLKPGEVRTFAHVVSTGQVITVKLFAVAGGSFMRLDVRSNGGLMPERSDNYQFESAALRDYIETLRWLVQQ